MRGGLDVILGALLLSSGLLAPGLLPSDDVLSSSNVTGSATFDQAHYTGPGEVEASEAAVEVRGPVEATLSAEEVYITHLDRRDVKFTHENDVLDRYERSMVALEWSYTDRIKNATIQVEGFDDGHMQAWPNASMGPATFHLELSSQTSTPITASAPSVGFLNHGEHYVLQGPLFALGDGIDRRINTEPINAGFDRLDLRGGINLLLDNGTVSVTHGGETERYDAEDRWTRSDPSDHAHVRDHSLVLLSLRGTSGALGFQEVDSTFFARNPDWTVDGALRFKASDGRLSAEGDSQALSNDSVNIQGRTNLSLTAEGTDRDEVHIPIVEHRAEIIHDNETRTQAIFHSDADNVSIAGEAVQVVSGSPSIPEEVTFWGKLLGLLMLAASIAKKLFGFLAPLVIDDPLGNDRRRRIFEFLNEARMAHRRQIHRATGIPNASLGHHLDVLVQNHLIAEVKQNGYTVYFPTSTELTYEDMEKLALLADPTRRSIAERIVEQGEETAPDLVDEEGLTRGQVYRQLAKLSEASLVEEEEAWPTSYRPSRLLQRWMREGSELA